MRTADFSAVLSCNERKIGPADRHHGIKSTEKREEFSLDIARFV